MIMYGTWLPAQEKVVVESILDGKAYGKYASPSYRARRVDGSIITIDRRDIILDEEQALIDELADILLHYKQPAKHERYAVIMKQFIIQGVPYASRLWKNIPPRAQQQTLDLFDAG